MDEAQHRKWDILIKGVITPIVAVITVLVGIYQYTDSQNRSLEREYELRKIERQERLFEEKAKLYRETRQTISFLSTNTDLNSELYLKNKNRFWELYWGDLAAVESSEIEAIMIKYGKMLSELEHKDPSALEEASSELKQLSLAFSHRSKEELNVEED